MKNNILLILAVTVISIGIIVATVMISGGDSGDESSSSQPVQRTSSTSDIYVQPTEDTPLAASPVTTEPVETSAPVESAEASYDSAALTE